MEQPRFKIVFDGALMPQTPLETAKENLARLFKSDTSKIDALFSGNPVVLKRDLSDDEADKYLRALHGAGANARKEADVAASLSLVETEDHPSEETIAARAAGEAASNERMTCPKCGHEQPKSIECGACGIIIEKYLARQAELAASAPPAAAAPAASAAAPTASPYAPPQAQVGEELPEFGELKPFAIDGRIGRVRYLGWTMALFLIFMPVIMLTMLLGMASEYIGIGLAVIATIAYIVISIRISIQRLHDIGWTGWLLLLYIVPIVGSVFPLLILLIPGTAGANRYGPPPPPNSRGVVVLAWTTLILPVLGILAAISIPAYQQYIDRAQSAQTQQYQHDDSAAPAASAEPSDEFNSGDTEGADSDAEPSDSEAQ